MSDRVSTKPIFEDETEDLEEGNTMALFPELMDDLPPIVRPDEDDEHYDTKNDGGARVASLIGAEPDLSDR